MSGPDLAFYQQWFSGYADKMRSRLAVDDQPVLDEFDMKVSHTYLVRDRAEDIARWLGLTGRDFFLASLCGLLHDLGRFVQAVDFGTMDDRVTGSHADLSEHVFLTEVPKEKLSSEEQGILSAALRCHNLFKLPRLRGRAGRDASDQAERAVNDQAERAVNDQAERAANDQPEGLDDRTLLYARLTRDADKLDIFRHALDIRREKEKRIFRFVQYDKAGDPDPSLLAAVLRGENINARNVQNFADRTLLEISLIYDLNFGISFRQVLDMGFVEGRIGGEERWAALVEYALAYARARTELRRPNLSARSRENA